MPQSYIERILRARVYDVASESPLTLAKGLSRRLGNQVFLKREDLQPVFSFKLRGAYARMCRLDVRQRALGVLAVSAGNHAQGVALAASRLGLSAVIVMPVTTPSIKVDAVRRLGAEVVLEGDGFDEASRRAAELQHESGRVFIHPFDDLDVIAGQGTVGTEIMRQAESPPDAVFVPVGGGGLIAGVAAAIKCLAPETRIIGVEPAGAASFKAALEAGRPVDIGPVSLFADGVAVRKVGAHPFRVARDLVDEVVTVGTDQICAAVGDVFLDTRIVTEPAGALAVAGMREYVKHGGAGRQLVAINSGANISFERMAHVVERAEIGAGHEVLFAATIPERPGSFLEFCRALGNTAVSEFNYRCSSTRKAHIFVGLRPADGSDGRTALFDRLRQSGYPIEDLTENALARDHLRHMVGGHCPVPAREVLYQFRFPERPGALRQFLTCLAGRFSISLFHYRNHGADYGRIVVGMQVPPEEMAQWQSFLTTLGYRYWDESQNPAYQLFL